jgi:hypothetical protein
MGWIFAETDSTPSHFQFEVRSEEIRACELLPDGKGISHPPLPWTGYVVASGGHKGPRGSFHPFMGPRSTRIPRIEEGVNFPMPHPGDPRNSRSNSSLVPRSQVALGNASSLSRYRFLLRRRFS